MSEDAKTIAESYGLKRSNFILDPIADYDCFARDDIPVSEIAAALDVDLVTGQAPKRLVWGPYGGGKTHMLMKTASELQKLVSRFELVLTVGIHLDSVTEALLEGEPQPRYHGGALTRVLG